MNRAFAGTLAAAALLHGGLILAASRLPAFALAPPGHAPQEVSIELLAPPRAAPEPAPTTARTSSAPAEPAQKVASYVAPRAAPRTGLAPPGASAELPASPGPGELPAPGGTAPGPAPAPHHPVNLGLGGDIYWMMHKQHPKLPVRAPRRRAPRTAGALAEGLEARDRARGHFRGGEVADAARDVANRVGPQQGHATFVVETGPHGHVRTVRMVGASADLELWNKVAQGLRAALLRHAALRVPPGARGLRVSVLVQARVQLPSGSSPGGSVHFKGAGLGFDVADIGATPKRVVYARITSEVVL